MQSWQRHAPRQIRHSRFALRRPGKRTCDGCIERVARGPAPALRRSFLLLGGTAANPNERSGVHPPTTAPSLKLRLQARPESALLLRQRLYLWLDALGASDGESFGIAPASTEAFAHAGEHPNQPTTAMIHIDGSISD